MVLKVCLDFYVINTPLTVCDEQPTVSNLIKLRSIKMRRRCQTVVLKNVLQSHSYSETYYLGIKNDPTLNAKLTGSWETLVGEQDTFVHILEYENYGGLDKTINLVRSSPEVRLSFQSIKRSIQILLYLARQSFSGNVALPAIKVFSIESRVCVLPLCAPTCSGRNF